MKIHIERERGHRKKQRKQAKETACEIIQFLGGTKAFSTENKTVVEWSRLVYPMILLEWLQIFATLLKYRIYVLIGALTSLIYPVSNF